MNASNESVIDPRYFPKVLANATEVPREPPRNETGLACPSEFEPVCGTDGNTYRNSCIAAKFNVDVKNEGVCLAIAKTDGCEAGFSPACGRDGTTYATTCALEAAGVELFYVGNCVIGESGVLGPNRCSDTAGYVCGENGLTFQNACLAATYGIDVISNGHCN